QALPPQSSYQAEDQKETGRGGEKKRPSIEVHAEQSAAPESPPCMFHARLHRSVSTRGSARLVRTRDAASLPRRTGPRSPAPSEVPCETCRSKSLRRLDPGGTLGVNVDGSLERLL